MVLAPDAAPSNCATSGRLAALSSSRVETPRLWNAFSRKAALRRMSSGLSRMFGIASSSRYSPKFLRAAAVRSSSAALPGCASDRMGVNAKRGLHMFYPRCGSARAGQGEDVHRLVHPHASVLRSVHERGRHVAVSTTAERRDVARERHFTRAE